MAKSYSKRLGDKVWAQLVKEFSLSGLSVAKFSQLKNISKSALKYHYYKAGGSEKAAVALRVQPPEQRPIFREIHVRQQEVIKRKPLLKIATGNGLQIRVCEQIDPQWLGALLRELA